MAGNNRKPDGERRFPINRGLAAEPIGKLSDDVGKEFVLQGTDQHGEMVEWVVKPTGANSFELTVPKKHHLGSPAAWENISILSQNVVTRGSASDCGCDGSQCGCQGSNCGSNSHLIRGDIRLLASEPEMLSLRETDNK